MQAQKHKQNDEDEALYSERLQQLLSNLKIVENELKPFTEPNVH
jgi:hypothetical protein